jgi:hypothetical protein
MPNLHAILKRTKALSYWRQQYDNRAHSEEFHVPSRIYRFHQSIHRRNWGSYQLHTEEKIDKTLKGAIGSGTQTKKNGGGSDPWERRRPAGNASRINVAAVLYSCRRDAGAPSVILFNTGRKSHFQLHPSLNEAQKAF